jgi:hypothetical protein
MTAKKTAAKAVRSAEDELAHVPIQCPQCSYLGKVRIDRLDRGFTCSECASRFYIDNTGQCMLGDPPPKKETAYGAPPPRRTETPSDVAKWAHQTIERFQQSPRIVKIAAAAAPLFLLLAVAGLWAATRGEPLPDGLLDRAVIAGECVAREDSRRLASLSTSSAAARQWMNKARPDTWTPIEAPNAFVDVRPRLISQKETKAMVSLTIARPTPGESPEAIKLITYWANSGEWLLDAERTLEAME